MAAVVYRLTVNVTREILALRGLGLSLAAALRWAVDEQIRRLSGGW